MNEQDLSTISLRTRLLIEQLSQNLFGKEKSIRLTLLSSIAGESIFFLGPPGVAKSMIARRLKYAFEDARTFEYLMGKFSTPDEVFGPVSIKKLKDQDKYERMVDNYLPGAHIVFLDEIWKASPAIQNSLLTVINEKIYRNGDQEIQVHLRGLVAASNELPRKGEGLEALWDRFLIRILILNIEEEQLFNEMVKLPYLGTKEDCVDPHLKISESEYYQWQQKIDQVEVPDHILGVVHHIRYSIQQRNSTYEDENKIYVSDRRWRKIIKLLRTATFLNGREAIEVMDCFLISDCIWQHPDQIDEMNELVKGSIASYGFMRLVHTESIRKELEQLGKEIEKGTHKKKTTQRQRIKSFQDDKQNSYAHIMEFWSEDNVYVRVHDLEKLSPQSEGYIPIFERSGKVFRPFQTYAFYREAPFMLKTKNKMLPIETETTEEEIVEIIVPSDSQKNIWNRRIDTLLEAIDEDLDTVERQKEQESQGLSRNVFVPTELAQIVHQSIQRTVNELLNTRLEIEKLQDSYVSIGQD